MNSSADVVIIGGGVIGLTAALRLAQAGLSVAILERGRTGREASWAGAGILPPGDSAWAATTVDRFRCRSVDLYPSLSKELHELTGIDNEFHVCGGIEFLDDAHLDLVEHWRNQRIAVRAATNDDLWNVLVPSGLTPFALPGFAQVRNPLHLKALRAGCERLGVSILEECEVVRLERTAERCTAVETSNGTRVPGRSFVLASGAWSGEMLGNFGVALPVRPVRGQMLLYRTEQPLLKSILLHDRRYVVPRRDGRMLVGSTEEDFGDFCKKPTEVGLAELRGFAESLLPKLLGQEPIQAWAGLRPGTPDGLPYIGVVPGFTNLIVAAGHFRAGLQLAPATTEMIASLILGVPAFDAEFATSFALDRIPNVTHRRTFRS